VCVGTLEETSCLKYTKLMRWRIPVFRLRSARHFLRGVRCLSRGLVFSDSDVRLRLRRELDGHSPSHSPWCPNPVEPVESEWRASCVRQLRDAVLPWRRAAETDNNPERCSLSGGADRPPTNQRAGGTGTFPRVGQSSVIGVCYHRDALGVQASQTTLFTPGTRTRRSRLV